jgi:phage virion morphogenesis protein
MARTPKVPFTTTTPRQSEAGAIVIGLHEMERLRKRFGDLAHAMGDTTRLIEAIGEQQVNSAKRRISETKRAPSGRPWKPWSENYRKTRGPQHSLFVSEGHLRDSIASEILSPGEVLVGSNLAYAGVHLYGSKDGRIPARPYLDTTGGFADPSDRRELRDVIRDFWEEELAA